LALGLGVLLMPLYVCKQKRGKNIPILEAFWSSQEEENPVPKLSK
jgi:hypothetical protein